MSTLREQILQAVIASYIVGIPAGVPKPDRERFISFELANLPATVIRPGDTRQRVGAVDRIGGRGAAIVQRNAFVTVIHRAAATPTLTADAVLDPLLAWTVKALVGQTLGGLCLGIEEAGEPDWHFGEGEKPICTAIQTLIAPHTTRVSDAELRT